MVARGLRLTTVAPLSCVSHFLCLSRRAASREGTTRAQICGPYLCCRTQHYTPCCWLPNNILKHTS